ncbi:MAG: cysteine desulfurase family protein [Bacillota bacterium]
MIYLDNSSTTKPHPLVVEAVKSALEENFGNPSSLHRLGLLAERTIKEAREKVADLIKASADEIVFTSGGTESNHLAIRSILSNSLDRHVITSIVEHPSVMAVFEEFAERGWEVEYLPVDKTGHVDLEALANSLRKDTVLVSVMAVNNELGTIQPIAKIGKILESYPKTYFHVDAVQAVGKVPLELNRVDLLSMSAHKIHGPKGIGALYIRKGRKFQSIMPGGGQEKGYRGGTENVPAIAGFGEAAEIALEKMPDIGILKAKRDELAAEIKKLVPECTINSPDESVLILSVSFPNIKSEVLLHSLEEKAIYVSTGSACSSKKKAHPVLTAIGLDDKLHEGTIRFSLGWGNEDIDPSYIAKITAQKVREIQLLLE